MATQQVAEKAIKAMLIGRSIEFPYMHKLAHRLSLLEEAGEIIAEQVRQAEGLTPYVGITRYPGVVRPVNKREYRAAVKTAEAVMLWAEERLRLEGNRGAWPCRFCCDWKARFNR